MQDCSSCSVHGRYGHKLLSCKRICVWYAPGKYFRIDDSFPDIERLCFGNDFVITVKQDRENIQFQCFCQIECSFVETFHLSVIGTCAFRENGDGIAGKDQLRSDYGGSYG